jgi:hypothetical protein
MTLDGDDADAFRMNMDDSDSDESNYSRMTGMQVVQHTHTFAKIPERPKTEDITSFVELEPEAIVIKATEAPKVVVKAHESALKYKGAKLELTKLEVSEHEENEFHHMPSFIPCETPKDIKHFKEHGGSIVDKIKRKMRNDVYVPSTYVPSTY